LREFEGRRSYKGRFLSSAITMVGDVDILIPPVKRKNDL
jgi:hypothetical protein